MNTEIRKVTLITQHHKEKSPFFEALVKVLQEILTAQDLGFDPYPVEQRRFAILGG